jgi:ABC-type thiamin/hydroxymethylpyrimidine transport system permease subunit
MVIVLVSSALTVAFTRLFLELTGYPQIGNSTFHIAHALCGGLALFLAGVMVLIVQNRGSAALVALLTGVGFGLFVDEVGKFITKQNDYFFPLAAPIVYASSSRSRPTRFTTARHAPPAAASSAVR